MPVSVHRVPGHLPPGWDKSVIFFANLLSLFYGNDSETNVLRQEVGALETYGGRLIPILNLLFHKQQNILVLEKDQQSALIAYFTDSLGLSLPKIRVMDHATYLKAGRNHPCAQADQLLRELQGEAVDAIDGYVTDEALKSLAQRLDKPTITTIRGSRDGNNKLKLNDYLCQKNVPTFETVVAQSPEDVIKACASFEAQGFKQVVVKSQIGASGIGMMKVLLSEAATTVFPDYLFFEGACLVQGWLDGSVDGVSYICSPSVQMFLNEESVTLHDITEQILSKDSVHEGNIAPPPHLLDDQDVIKEMLIQAEIAGRWLYDQEYRGTASVDFHVIERRGIKEVRICEINARVTGATYPSLLARHYLPRDAWLMRNIRFQPFVKSDNILRALLRGGLLFEPGQAKGVLPFNFNTDEDGHVKKGQFLFLGRTPQEAEHVLHAMAGLQAIRGVFDRD